jgi:hypothetical protein
VLLRCDLCDLCVLCVAFFSGAEVAPSISSGALRFGDDESAAPLPGTSVFFDKRDKIFFAGRILGRRGAALFS